MRPKPCSEAMSLMCRRPPPRSVLLREKPWIWQGFLEQKIILGKVNGKRNGKPCVPNLAPKTIMEPEVQKHDFSGFMLICCPCVHSKMYQISMDYMKQQGRSLQLVETFMEDRILLGPTIHHIFYYSKLGRPPKRNIVSQPRFFRNHVMLVLGGS